MQCDFQISIHAPPRGATNDVVHILRLHLISIHAPPRGATKRCYMANMAWIFQFTPLREGRRSEGQFAECAGYFNSRPSARGDLYYPPFGVIQLISIHAPPRGATRNCRMTCKRNFISIHAPPRGATQYIVSCRWFPENFNSRPSARGDGIRRGSRGVSWDISIHAPPRGAT